MRKAKVIALSMIPLFFLGSTVQAMSFESIKAVVNACLPVKLLPSPLSLDDAKALWDANYSPSWCQLVSQLGYQPDRALSNAPLLDKEAIKEGRRAAERATNECLLAQAIGVEPSDDLFSLRNRIVAYVSHQYQCEKSSDSSACKRAKRLSLNIVYTDLPEKEARRMKVRLKKIQRKSKTCPFQINQITQYCQNIGLRTKEVCNNL
jgi:hypothetical protein